MQPSFLAIQSGRGLLAALLVTLVVVQACGASLKVDLTVTPQTVSPGGIVKFQARLYDPLFPNVKISNIPIHITGIRVSTGDTFMGITGPTNASGWIDSSFMAPAETGRYRIHAETTVNYNSIPGLPHIGDQFTSHNEYFNITQKSASPFYTATPVRTFFAGTAAPTTSTATTPSTAPTVTATQTMQQTIQQTPLVTQLTTPPPAMQTVMASAAPSVVTITTTAAAQPAGTPATAQQAPAGTPLSDSVPAAGDTSPAQPSGSASTAVPLWLAGVIILVVLALAGGGYWLGSRQKGEGKK